MQGVAYANDARLIRRRLKHGYQAETTPFRYRNMGNLATIGRNAAVIEYGHFRLKGWLAWWVWGIAHIYFLIGVRNRLSVALSWLWIYVRNQRSARLITQGQKDNIAAERPTNSSPTIPH